MIAEEPEAVAMLRKQLADVTRERDEARANYRELKEAMAEKLKGLMVQVGRVALELIRKHDPANPPENEEPPK